MMLKLFVERSLSAAPLLENEGLEGPSLSEVDVTAAFQR